MALAFCKDLQQNVKLINPIVLRSDIKRDICAIWYRNKYDSLEVFLDFGLKCGLDQNEC